MSSVIDLIRAATQRGPRAVREAVPSAPPPPAPTQPVYQGYVDERSTHHVAGWVRNLADPAERIAYEVVLAVDDAERVLAHGRSDSFSDILVRVGVGDGTYAFRAEFDPPLTEIERDCVFVRPAGAEHRLELAPELKTNPPGVAPSAPLRGPFQGYIDERSTDHVAGWVWNLADADERVAFEIVLPTAAGERVLYRGRADVFSNVLVQIGIGDGTYSFYVLLNERLTEAERDAVFVRPTDSTFRLQLAPAVKTVFEPISHIAMDIVNNCNLRCPFCVYDYANTRTTKFMSEATFDAALRLIPYVTDGNFWLSCLHEATLHPQLIAFIERVPAHLRHKLFYTTNLAKRMPPGYFAFLAGSGMHHLNISVESFDPAIYERMRKGARHRIFMENWQKLLEAFAVGTAVPRLRYNLMAYRSNLREIPALVEVLLRDKMAWQVEIRHTYDEPHIPSEFRESEFLDSAEWAWLADQLKDHDPQQVLLLLPPAGVGYDRPDSQSGTETAAASAQIAVPIVAADNGDLVGSEIEAAVEAMAQPSTEKAPISQPGGRYDCIPRPLNISMDWDGTMRIYGETPRGPGEPPIHVNYLMTNITFLKDPIRFLLAL